jgi:hypothetical protein
VKTIEFDWPLGPKDRELVDPSVRAGVDSVESYRSAEGALLLVPALRASELERMRSPSSRTGLLNSGPSDLTHAD